jgi:hypothetical protein
VSNGFGCGEVARIIEVDVFEFGFDAASEFVSNLLRLRSVSKICFEDFFILGDSYQYILTHTMKPLSGFDSQSRDRKNKKRDAR